jgi:hypothetical protein
VKEVPYEVIIEREVIVEKEIFIEKIIELPQRTIIK